MDWIREFLLFGLPIVDLLITATRTRPGVNSFIEAFVPDFKVQVVCGAVT